MFEIILIGLFNIGMFIFFFYQIKGLKDDLKSIKNEKESKIDDLYQKKDKELQTKIDVINDWKKYINYNVSDLIYFERNLIVNSGSANEVRFECYIEGQILDIAKSKVKIKVDDVTFDKSHKSIVKSDVINYLTDQWYNLHLIEKRLSFEERRDILLSKILDK